jgi:hypothetical protein
LALIPWEYGPMALGALGVETASRDCPLIHLPPIKLTDKNIRLAVRGQNRFAPRRRGEQQNLFTADFR